MHEAERHRIILSEVNQRSVVSINELKLLLGSSEATVRRDIVRLDKSGMLRRIRGGAEPLTPPMVGSLLGKPYVFNETVNIDKKIAIGKLASLMCEDGDSIIINGGTTTFQMVANLVQQSLNVLTNSWTIADYLHNNSKHTVTLPGGTLYREQNIILSPFHDGVSSHFLARLMFIGAQGVNSRGLLESDPLILQAEQKLMSQAEKIIVVVDSSKFQVRNSLILCSLDQVDTLITDSGINDESRQMLKDSGVNLKIAEVAIS